MLEIPLTQGYIALIDDEDYLLIENFSWNVWKRDQFIYARAWERKPATIRKKVFMHTVIMDTPEGMLVDHLDGNGLNNQRYNLRVTNKTGNNNNRNITSSRGSSKHLGVFTINGRFRAQINRFWLGDYDDEEKAASVYREAKEVRDKMGFSKEVMRSIRESHK